MVLTAVVGTKDVDSDTLEGIKTALSAAIVDRVKWRAAEGPDDLEK
jgi:hypothetical protein